MMRWRLNIIVATLCFWSSVSSELHQLHMENFESHVKGTQLLVVSFCVPWYEPCQALTPELEAATDALKPRNIYISEIDCTEDASICDRYDIQSYPTIRIFQGPGALERTPARYRGPQRTKQVVSHMIKRVLPLISEINADNIEEFKSLDTSLLVGYLDPHDTEPRTILIQAAESPLHENFLFGTATDRALFESGNSKRPLIVLWNPADEVPAIYEGEFEVEKITKFAEDALASPLIPQFGMQKFAEYPESGLPLALIFSLTQEERTSLAQTFKSVAMKNRGRMNFATVDAVRLPFLAEPLGLDGKRWPAFVVHDIEDDETFVYDQGKMIEGQSVGNFVEEFWGKMEGKKDKGESESGSHDEL